MISDKLLKLIATLQGHASEVSAHLDDVTHLSKSVIKKLPLKDKIVFYHKLKSQEMSGPNPVGFDALDPSGGEKEDND